MGVGSFSFLDGGCLSWNGRGGKNTGVQMHIRDNDNCRPKSRGNIHCLSVLRVALRLEVVYSFKYVVV